MPELSLILPMLALLLGIGALTGILAGLMGVGGGIVLVPGFFYAFTYLGYGGPELMRICLATSLATILVTSGRAVMGHHRRDAVDWELLRGWAPWVVAGALLGVAVVAQLASGTLQILFGTLGVLVGLQMAFGRPHWRLGHSLPAGRTRAGLAGGVGLISVLLGVGGGGMAVTVLTLFGMAMHRAVGTAAGFGLIIAVPSVTLFLLIPTDPALSPPFTVGAVNLAAFAVIVSMTLLTTPLGVRIAHALDPVMLRRAFAVFIILLAGNMLRRALGF